MKSKLIASILRLLYKRRTQPWAFNALLRIAAAVLLISLCVLPVAIAPRDARAAFGDCIAYDTFTRDDGAIGSTETSGPSSEACPQYAWTGGTWTISGSKVVDAPTLGTDLWDAAASTFDSGTYAWVKYGNNTIANVSNALLITYVDNGSGAYELLKNTSDLSSDLTLGTWYALSLSANVNAGASVGLFLQNGVNSTYNPPITSTTPATIPMSFRSASTTACTLGATNMGSGETLTLDNLSLKPITFSSQVATVNTGTVSGTYSASATINPAKGTQAGIALLLNSQESPTAGIVLYIDGTYLYVVKFISATEWTQLSRDAITYADGRIIKADITTTSGHVYLDAYYHGTKFQTQLDITDAAIISNTYHGVFSTYSGNSLDNFYISNNIPNTATPTNTATNTTTNTPTASDTTTNTPTDTATFTPTASDTPTNTPTHTATFTNTFTITYTPTFTDTPTETYTPTETNTSTASKTPTNTFTPTNTATLHYDATTTYEAAYAYYTGIAEENYPTVLILSVLCGVILLGGIVWAVFYFLRRRR